MSYKVSHPTKILKGTIELTASKSESNRALIIQALCEDEFEIKNLAAAEDTRVLKEILTKVKANTSVEVQTYDVGAAGTTMRFLTAYLASKKEVNCILTGSERMQNRPIKILVDALRDLGADIEYVDKEGYPPLRIKGKELEGGQVEIAGDVSSQYITALLLIAPILKNGLILKFKGEVTSVPYVNMTLAMMEVFGIYHKSGKKIPIGKHKYDVTNEEDYSHHVDHMAGDNSKGGKKITLNKHKYEITNERDRFYFIEGDWSSASYWYAIAVFAEEVDFTIKGLKKHSLQGDAVVVEVFKSFGIKTEYIDSGVRLTKSGKPVESFKFDFSSCPDIAQTVAVVVGALGIPSTYTGLHTLRIKETDRTLALKNELAKIGVEVEIVNDDKIKIHTKTLVQQSSPIATYEDHRMAMAFAPLAMIQESITIEHPEVVKKSYPDFWRDLKKLDFVLEER